MDDSANGVRTCSRCWVVQPHAEFWKGQTQCRSCRRLLNVEALFGLSPEEYARLIRRQKGVCAICRKPDARYENLPVDHDRTTKKVRGLLCTRCNRGIGQLQHNPVYCERAAQYLRRRIVLPSPVRAKNLTRAEGARRAKFGVERNQYEHLLEQERHACAICRSTTRRLGVDHRERDGVKVIRGLLCVTCNVALGSFENSPPLLRKAGKYLLRHQTAG